MPPPVLNINWRAPRLLRSTTEIKPNAVLTLALTGHRSGLQGRGSSRGAIRHGKVWVWALMIDEY